MADPYKFDEQARDRFCQVLSETGHISNACKAAGVSYTTMRRYRKGGALEDESFEERYQDAHQQYLDHLFDVARKRATEGYIERPIFDKDGNHVGDVHKVSDRLLEVLMVRLAGPVEQKVAVTSKNETTIKHQEIDYSKLSKAERDQLRELMAKLNSSEDEGASTEGEGRGTMH